MVSATPPPLFTQRRAFVPMLYWLHARACPLAYRARHARAYRVARET
jgi:hypothetical protein